MIAWREWLFEVLIIVSDGQEFAKFWKKRSTQSSNTLSAFLQQQRRLAGWLAKSPATARSMELVCLFELVCLSFRASSIPLRLTKYQISRSRVKFYYCKWFWLFLRVPRTLPILLAGGFPDPDGKPPVGTCWYTRKLKRKGDFPFQSLFNNRPRMEKSHSCWPRTVWCVVNMFHKNGMRPWLISNGTICY